MIEEWREYSKLLNTYLQPLPSLLAEDGRLHTHFNQAVASTGRLSTSNPNLQAIPIRTELGREIRSAFVAEPGHKLVSADYSQVELRILAHVSGEPKLRESFARGEDIHTTTAAEVLGKDPATLTKDERNIAKMVNFGIIYGISSYGLSENLEIARDEAQEYIDTYLARFPYVQDFIARTIEQAKRDGYVTTLFGRRRPVPEIRASNRQTRGLGERLAVNSVMQGTAADIIKVAMVNIHRRLQEEGRSSRLVLQVHDELLVEAPEREVAAVKERCAKRWSARSTSTRRSRSRSAPATTGTRRSPSLKHESPAHAAFSRSRSRLEIRGTRVTLLDGRGRWGHDRVQRGEENHREVAVSLGPGLPVRGRHRRRRWHSHRSADGALLL